MAKWNMKRLIEEQSAALASTDEQLQQWNKFKDDYTKLKTKLQELPDQVSHDYMVPFGPMAFMPGKLIHTNEILVLLGDNWFAEVSAKHSCEIIDRRLANVEESIKKLGQQRKLLESRTSFTNEEFTSEEIDIAEEYDSDEDRKWRESHKQSVRKDKLAARKVGCHSDEDVFGMLEKLQVREMQHDEISQQDDETQEAHSYCHSVQATRNKAVHWEEDKRLKLPVGEDESSSSLDSDDSVCEGAVIHFKHSPRTSEADHGPSEGQGDDRICSPSDIYTLYSKPVTKSILKQERSFEEIKSISSGPVTQSMEAKKDRVKFTDEKKPAVLQEHIVERTSTVQSNNPHEQSETNHASPTSGAPEKQLPAPRVSKFKSMRQKRQSS